MTATRDAREPGAGRELRQAVGWSLAAVFGPRLITPLSTVAVSLLLWPRDFGIAAAAAAFSGLVPVFLAFGPAVSRERDEAAGAANGVFWLSLGTGLGLGALLWLAAPVVARWTGIPEVAPALRIGGATGPILGAGAAPQALLQRDFRFREVFAASLATTATTAAATVTMAVAGLGYAALVAGPLAGLAAGSLVAWRSAGFRPGLPPPRAPLGRIARFGAWNAASGLSSWCFGHADNLLCAWALGAASAGLYALGFGLAGFLPGMASAAIGSVAFPLFCRLQGEARAVGLSLARLQALTATAVFPGCVAVACLAGPAVRLVYGERWPGLDHVLVVLSLSPGVTHVWALTGEALRATGRTQAWARSGGLAGVLMLAALAAGTRFGLEGFLAARAASAFLMPLLATRLARRHFGLDAREQAATLAGPLAASAGMGAVILAVMGWSAPLAGIAAGLALAAVALGGLAAYLALLRLLAPRAWDDLVALVRGSLEAGSPSAPGSLAPRPAR